MDAVEKKAEKFVSYFHVMNVWMTCMEQKKELKDYFIKYEYPRIAIYGAGVLGKHLYKQLKESGMQVEYTIDVNAEQRCGDIKTYTWDEEWPEVDAIVVTPVFDFNQIEERLAAKVDCAVVSLEEVVNEFL